MIKVVFQILCCLGAVGFIFATPFSKCTKMESATAPVTVSVVGCDSEVDTCKVKINDFLNMTMVFKAPHYLESMVPTLIGNTFFGSFNFTMDSDDYKDVCTGLLNTVCPLVAQEIIIYRYSVKLIVLPLIPITFEFSIIDTDLNEVAVCFEVDIVPDW